MEISSSSLQQQHQQQQQQQHYHHHHQPLPQHEIMTVPLDGGSTTGSTNTEHHHSNNTVIVNNNDENHSHDSSEHELNINVSENDGGGKTTVLIIAIISILMMFNSILLLYQYHLQYHHSTSTGSDVPTAIMNTNDTTNLLSFIPTLTSDTLLQQQHCVSQRNETRLMMTIMNMSTAFDTPSVFVWHVSIEMSMTIITNLIHAALLLVVGIIVSVRHDVVWMLYLYHTTLFWMIVAICTLIVILYQSISNDVEEPVSFLYVIQSTAIAFFGICTTMVWYRYRPSYTRTLQAAYDRNTHTVTTGTAPHHHPNHNHHKIMAVRVIYYASRLLQYGMMGYYIITTLQYLHDQQQQQSSNETTLCPPPTRSLHDWDDHNDALPTTTMSWMITTTNNNTSMTTSNPSPSMDMNDFVMSYSEVAHLTFVLALLQLSMIYPNSLTCCMGTIIVAGWKLLLNTVALWYTLGRPYSPITMWTTRTQLSLFYTMFDISIMIPIFISSLYLYYWNSTNNNDASNNNNNNNDSVHHISCFAFWFLRRRRTRACVLPPTKNYPSSRTKWTRFVDDTTSSSSSSSSTTYHSSTAGVSMNTEDVENEDANFVSSGVVVSDPNDKQDEVMEISNPSMEDGIMKVNHTTSNDSDNHHDIAMFECRTTFQIASSSSSSLSLLSTKQATHHHHRHQYTRRQQYGAKLLSYGSLVLLVGMTLESIVLQSQSFLFVDHAKYDLYKWGLHLCVMYTFTTVMCLNVGDSMYYELYCRPILLLASPAGSLIAAYQCFNLLWNSNNSSSYNNNARGDTSVSTIVLWLFIVRCICGIVQTMGVYLLNTIRPHHHQYCATTVSLSSSNSHDDDDDDSNSASQNSDGEHHVIDIDDDGSTTVVSFIANDSSLLLRQQRLQLLHDRIHILFYYLFIPIMIVYIAMSVVSHHNNNNNNDDGLVCLVPEPNISPMIPSAMMPPTLCSDGAIGNNSSSSSTMDMDMNMEGGNGFMLMPNIPGLGLYFHFGLVLLLFIYDGIQRTVPTYAPSLFLATVSTYHLSILLFTDLLLWDVLQTQLYTTISLSSMEMIQRMVQLLWSIVAGCLAYSLHQFWNLRVTA